MDPERRKAHLPYHEQLMDAVDELESLVDRYSFEHLLADTAFERTTTFASNPGSYIYIEREDMPEDLMEQFVFDRNFFVRVDEAQLTELPTSRGNDWTLTAVFQATNDPRQDPTGRTFRFTSTPQSMVCYTTNFRSETVQSSLKSLSGQRFFTSLLASAILSQDMAETSRQAFYQKFKEADRQSTLSPEQLIHTLSELGMRLGSCRQSTLSYIPHPEGGDRAIVAQLSETDGPAINNRTLDFYMNTQLLNKVSADDTEDGNTKHTALTSMELESINHRALGSLESINKQFASRFPTPIKLDDLRFAVRMNMFDSSEAHLFGSATNREQYGLVAATIMTVIRPALRPYLRYDID